VSPPVSAPSPVFGINLTMKICWRSDLLVPSVVLLSLIAVQPIHAADLSEHLRPQGTAAQQVHDPTPTASGAVEASPDMSQPSKAPTHMPSTDAFAEDEASDEAALGVCLGLGLLLAVGLSAVVVLRYSDPTQVLDRIVLPWRARK